MKNVFIDFHKENYTEILLFLYRSSWFLTGDSFICESLVSILGLTYVMEHQVVIPSPTDKM